MVIPITLTANLYVRLSVYMLPWPARSPDMSPTEHAFDVFGRQFQHHPLTNPVLTQVQQAWNPIPQSDIWHLHATVQAYIENSGDYTGY
ncbi:uncharacterized protein TNCV_3412341 [Trichonephila clavipes]|uniref:Uncharacterized protein n=1 Tax=Trichonephila clavipes TaxID=2585209 RepID=A0A8X6UV36_TRICX|nr:uncharacterized protein TNCV_3412341 [Trichonephila clavipes]